MLNNQTIILPSNVKELPVNNTKSTVKSSYKCGDGSGYFLIDNLFSELIDEYQRARARKNLGIKNSDGTLGTYNIYYGTDESDLIFSNIPQLTVNADNNSFIYIALDNEDLCIYVNGICGGFYEHDRNTIDGIDYIIYRSTNPNLGLTNIEIR